MQKNEEIVKINGFLDSVEKHKKTYKADTVPASGTTVPNPQQHPVAVSLGPMAPPPVRPPSPPPPPQQSDEVSILTSMNLW